MSTPRALRAELDELAQLQRPCILHWDLNHFTVLVDLARGEATIHHPARGLRRIRFDELSRHFTGVVLELHPAPGFMPAVERQHVGPRQLLGPVSGWRRSLAQIVALALALEAFVLLGPFLMQWTVDGVRVRAYRDLLVTLVIGFALLVGLQVATAAARPWAALVMSATLKLQWLVNVFAHLMRLPVGWFEKRHAGHIWSRLGTAQRIQRTLTTSFVEALLDGALVLLTLAMMWFYSPMLSAVAIAAVAAYGPLRRAFIRPLREASEEALVFEARQSSHFPELLRGIEAFKPFGAQGERGSRFASLVVDTMNANIAVRKLELLFSVLHRGLLELERVAVIGHGALRVLDREFSVGVLFAFFAWKETFAQRVSALADKVAELKMLRLHGERLADIVLTAPEADAGSGASRAGRSVVGAVIEDEPLFAGSLADNTGFFEASPDRAGIEQCARVAAVHEAIEARPMGYDTLIGDMGRRGRAARSSASCSRARSTRSRACC